MTCRSTFLFLTALLLIASLAGAATAPAQSAAPAITAPATVAFMTPAAPVQADAGCNPLLAKLGISLLDSARNTAALHCGACSDVACRGANFNQVCGTQGAAIKKCVTLYGDRCPEDGQFNCACYYGPIP
jgi:hypothetical protein